ncbi:MAG: aldehyde dehydrogenase family protein [Desulfuromonadales bacterium]|nr:aldehyde dehydrogenase family protein [Desulfuromonadales bacterium]
MTQFNLIIDGKKVKTDMYFNVLNPATGEIVGQCPNADLQHLDQAVAAAKKAFPSWSQIADDLRVKMLYDLADAMERHQEELMRLLTMEMGKPLVGYQGIGSGMEVGGAVAWTRATAALNLPVEIIQDDASAFIEVHRKPLGVVGSIPPWNWPLLIAVWHVIPALRSGNTVVIKPSSLTPLSTLRFVEIANEILPPGVFNIVTAEKGIGSAMARHPDIQKIVFTGSTPTGKQIMENASGNLKRLTLELGGNDAGIVLPDVNVKEVAPQIFAAAFNNNGQTCAALKRLYVHQDIYEPMCAALTEIACSLKTGNGLDDGVDLGPLQNREQFELVCELAEDARKAGGRFLCGGTPMKGTGYFYPATLVADLNDGVRLVDEEQFGPILPIIRYSDEADALLRANNSPFGLGGSVWSADTERAKTLAMRLECGTAWINTHATIQPNAPFGGVKESGFGVEFGRYGLEEYTSIQTVKIAR